MIAFERYISALGSNPTRNIIIAIAILLIPFVGFNPALGLSVVLGAWFLVLIITRPLWLVYLIVLLLPLDNYLPIIQVPILRAGATTVNIVALAATISFMVQWLQKRLSVRWSTSHKLFAGFVAINFLLIPWSINSRESLVRSINWLLFFGLYLTLYQFLPNPKIFRHSMLLYASAGWFILGTGLLQAGIGLGNNRLEGLLGNPNSFATAIIACSLGVLLFAINAQKGKLFNSLNPTIYLSLVFMAILLSASRGGFVGIVLTILGTSLLGRSRKTVMTGLALSTIIILTSTLWPQLYDTILSRFSSEGSDLLGGRIRIWEISLQLIRENPWIGYGSGNASSLAGNVLVSKYQLATSVKSIHNPFLEVWIENGLVGLIPYTLSISIPLALVVRTLVRDSKSLSSISKLQYAMFLSVVSGYLSLWIKNGGSTYDKNLFIFLTVALTLYETIPHNRLISEK